MAISRATEPITADDEAIRKALEDAILPALLPALAQATGDFSLLRDDLHPVMAMGDVQGGLTEEQQETARALALDALKTLRDGGATAEQRPVEDDVRRISQWITSSPASDDYVRLCIEELAVSGQDARAPTWHAGEGVDFRVAIIGAGMSGILAGIRLKQAGVPFVIIEKNADVGGTWLENTYPGARVDVQSALYSYSFAQKIDWPGSYSTQPALLDYFRDCADEQGIREQIRFNTEVRSATFDEEACTWSLQLQPADGDEETIEVQAVISAVGQLNRPKMPDIAGRESFKGPSFHSAQWDHSVDLTGKRVAVIGTGASAAQFVPEIAKDVAALSVFQRTPAWFFPSPTYHEETPAGQQWLFRHVPHYLNWYRLWTFWGLDNLLSVAVVDENWESEGPSVSALNDGMRQVLTMSLTAQYDGRPDLLEKVLPTYPPAAKRILVDNGSWSETLKRDNVELITDEIKEITPDGVVTEDGELIEADVIVYGTGFEASRFLMPMEIVGRREVVLSEQWGGDARAYLGITVPNFPNFFLLYGPNTNLVINASIISFAECEVQYVLGCVRMLLKDGHRAMDCKQDVHDAYNERIDAANMQRAWGVSDVNSWYKNEHGRVAQNYPFGVVEYWQQTREPDPADYVFL